MPSVALVVIGLILLVVFVVQALRAVRRFRAVQGTATAGVRDRMGLLQARVAGLQVAIRERLHPQRNAGAYDDARR